MGERASVGRRRPAGSLLQRAGRWRLAIVLPPLAILWLAVGWALA